MQIVIIGAGAAGLMAAAEINAATIVLERNEKAGKKIYITGKGRCNLTNDCDTAEFLKNVLRGQKFIQSALFRFSPRYVMDFFEANGLPLKTERGRRVFPVSEKASDVSKTLIRKAENNGAKFIYNTFVKAIKPQNNNFLNNSLDSLNNLSDDRFLKTASNDNFSNNLSNNSSKTASNGGFEIVCDGGKTFFADILIVASGGKSYPATGSDGSIYGVLSSLGHSVTGLYPSLVPFVLDADVSALRGISFKNAGAKVRFQGGEVSSEGELLFTDSGVSGPVILTLSGQAAGKPLLSLSLDLRPNENADETDKKLINLFNQDANKEIKNILPMLLPKSLSSYIIDCIRIDPQKKANSITKAERALLVDSLKNLTFGIKGTAGFNEAVVTSGGVNLKDVDPKTMQSKLYPNLYIVGEVLDIDALTGGYNLQLAWSSALAAAKSINDKLTFTE